VFRNCYNGGSYFAILRINSEMMMDNFTLAVIVGDVVMCAAFVALMVLDKPRPATSTEPLKPAGKRSA
jgi:hypothetical protein